MKNYTASATLSDNTIVSIIVTVNTNNINIAVTVLSKGYYTASKQYRKTITKPERFDDMYIAKIIQNEVESIANSSEYKIDFNF